MLNWILAVIQSDLVASAVSTRDFRTLLWRVWEAWRDICKSTVSSPGASQGARLPKLLEDVCSFEERLGVEGGQLGLQQLLHREKGPGL